MNDRYIRQVILPGFGMDAQEKLLAAKVLIVGMGGLGCPVLQYLVAAGVGTIGIMDGDTVSMSNLHRQLLFHAGELGQPKVKLAAEKMKEQDSSILVQAYPYALTVSNAAEVVADYDLVIDATDNFMAKYLINDVCVLLNKPWIYGAVSQYQGQLSVFNWREGVASDQLQPINYRDLFPVSPAPHEIATCEEAGVIGVLPGIIGTMQAAEAIKIITGLGLPLYGRLYNYDLLQARSYEIAIVKQEDPVKIDQAFFEAMNYDLFCGQPEEDPDMHDIEEINVDTFMQLRADPDVFVLDVREKHEYPAIDFADAQIPMSELQTGMAALPDKSICVICHQGIRSVYAAQLIRARRNLTVYSLKGGLTAYFKKES
ncbi:MAG: ThiF family adenylyltransferase [Sediminibacterium sp.]